MGKYSIADLEKFSGIKAHTIRIWEQRYNLLHPQRTTTNIRYYDDEQLKKLLNVVLLIKSGIKISEISRMSKGEFHNELTKVTLQNQPPEFETDLYINELITAALAYDELTFEKIFSTCLLRYGLRNSYPKIIYPLLTKLGVMWGSDEISPGQEHFASNLIRQKLFTAIDGLPVPSFPELTFVLFLPEGENHELGLLYANFILKKNNCKTLYLGQSVPLSSLKEAVQAIKPSHLMTFMVRTFPKEEAQEYVNTLTSTYSNLKILISGNKDLLEQLQLPENIAWIESVDEFNQGIVQHFANV